MDRYWEDELTLMRLNTMTVSNSGYRRMRLHLSTSGLLFRGEDVRLALRGLDPKHVDERQC